MCHVYNVAEQTARQRFRLRVFYMFSMREEGNLRRVIGRTVIDHDHFAYFTALHHSHQGRQALYNEVMSVIDRHDNTDTTTGYCCGIT